MATPSCHLSAGCSEVARERRAHQAVWGNRQGCLYQTKVGQEVALFPDLALFTLQFSLMEAEAWKHSLNNISGCEVDTGGDTANTFNTPPASGTRSLAGVLYTC